MEGIVEAEHILDAVGVAGNPTTLGRSTVQHVVLAEALGLDTTFNRVW